MQRGRKSRRATFSSSSSSSLACMSGPNWTCHIVIISQPSLCIVSSARRWKFSCFRKRRGSIIVIANPFHSRNGNFFWRFAFCHSRSALVVVQYKVEFSSRCYLNFMDSIIRILCDIIISSIYINI